MSDKSRPSIDDLLAQRPAGKPVSGRVWKLPRPRASAINKKARLQSGSYAERMAIKAKTLEQRHLIDELRAERDDEKKHQRLRAKQRRLQREKNALKSSKVQIIKDSAKIKKMSKKQRRLVMTAAQFAQRQL